ncbi:hypothetical protein [Belliella pelovolcani]|uniref:DUF4843 domain-containing protein n=1 Tax=Belliella pelovolcani TaxID=529505 RepID=A0A1N7MZ02_9BACT|nr:hypothetical protein [Belliella pelovolcani]SIS91337.1 hypothetical protein SAMN05421761_1087 [Belliella pelovolcani]
MKKYIVKTVLFGFISLLCFACFEAPDRTFQGPEEFQFNNQTLGRIASTIPGIDQQSLTAKRVRQGVVTQDEVEIQLIGRQKSTDLNVAYTVDPASTAVQGVHYTLQSPNSVVLGANTSSAFLRYNVLEGIPVGGSPVTLILNLVGTDEIPGSENYKRFTITIWR